MPSLDENKNFWDRDYDWQERGDEWSAACGTVSHQWWSTLFPRIQGYLPAGRILEIAPGFGRWTHFLRDLCDELIIVDIAERAIAHCRHRFAADEHISAYVNNGTSLTMVADESIDLVFSFDSLVHVELDVISAYLAEIAGKLTANGIAFLHHSNMATRKPGTYDPDAIGWRGLTVSANAVEAEAARVGLSCVSQEILAWGNFVLLNDCISVITRRGSRWDRDNVVMENMTFTSNEIALAGRLSTLYPPSTQDVAFSARRRGHGLSSANGNAIIAEERVTYGARP
jgi:2-polyprenyl-3-methyl-5-hydroxy-6-metoxy-1,4-benzoquinol methylase